MEPELGRYRHFKGGDYLLLGIATHSESGERLAVYRALYGQGGLWVRPVSMWQEQVCREGYCGPRFVRVEEAV